MVPARDHSPSQTMRDQLQSVADPENGQPSFKKFQGKGRASVPEDGIRASRQDYARGLRLPNLVQPSPIGNNFAVYGKLSNPTADQLRILGAKIKNQYVFAVNELAPSYVWL